MRLIIEPNYEQLSKWAAKLCSSEDQAANPTAEKPFVTGLAYRIFSRWVCTRT
mgnify:CR=1 FL=1